MGIGSLVEIVDTNFTSTFYYIVKNIPVKGKIYTIRDIGVHVGSSGDVSILLEEIHNSPITIPRGITREPSFKAYRFRELLPPMTINIEEEQLCLI